MADATLPKPTDENEDVKPAEVPIKEDVNPAEAPIKEDVNPAEAPVDDYLIIDPNRDIRAGVIPQRARPTVGPRKPKPAQPAKPEPAKTPQTESEKQEPPAGPPPKRED